MDELSAFKFAPASLRMKERELLDRADIVFTGGHNLFLAKKDQHHNIHCFPSSIDKNHFFAARSKTADKPDQQSIPHPRIGFYGVIDERINIDLISELAQNKPEWHFILIGPVVKIDPATLPQAANIHWLGGKSYNELPDYLSGWDIAFMPFALNESTQYISPTKTPEFLAGAKPVISTSIVDVVHPYGDNGLVHIADTTEEFIAAAEYLLKNRNDSKWLGKVDYHLSGVSWDKTWHAMNMLVDNSMISVSI
jgi:UDP-galactopyranose mutase